MQSPLPGHAHRTARFGHPPTAQSSVNQHRIPDLPAQESTCLQTMTIDYLKKILTSRVYDVASETPLELAPPTYLL